jgi:vitamin B12 transporter
VSANHPRQAALSVLLGVSMLLVHGARAASAPGAADGDPLNPLVVTATRTAQPEDQVVASVTVITRAEIEARQPASVEELLRGEAGVQIVNQGGLGKVSTLLLRGMNSDQVLVLIDGVRLDSATAGITAITYLPVEAIERIEIVRGPRSSLYGADALGGVIQIFTKHGNGALAPQLALSAGSHGYGQVSGGASGAADPLSYSFAGAYQTTNGYDSCVEPFNPAGFDSCGTPNQDDHFHDASFVGRLGYAPTDSSEFEAFALRARGSSDFHSSYQNREYFVQQLLGLAGHWAPADGLRLSLRGGQAKDEATDTAIGETAVLDAAGFGLPLASIFDTTKYSATAQLDYDLAPRSTLSLGGDYLRDQVDGNGGYAETSRRNTAVFGQYDGHSDSQDLNFSLRRDDNQQFGTKWTGGAGWGYHFADGLRGSVSYGTGFKVPSFNELYTPGYGVPTLKPEASRTLELGLDQRLAAGRWSLHAYETHADNLIETTPNFSAENLTRVRIRGVEGQYSTAFAQNWRFDATAGWLSAHDDSAISAFGTYPGSDLPRRPPESGRVELTRVGGAWQVTGRVNVSSHSLDRDELSGNLVRVGGYATADVLAQWQFASAWRLEGKLANLADHRYQTALYYPQDGRNLLVTLRYQPQPGGR